MFYLDQIVQHQKQGKPEGIPSICSVQPDVLYCAIQHAVESGDILLVEATCNQVNQFGGYTGMKPVDFVHYISGLAEEHHLPIEQIILGGDHLGPSPWQEEPAKQAMQKAGELVKGFARAGFTKIHLDASMHLGDDSTDAPLNPEIAAARSAWLAKIVEANCPVDQKPCYVIGTEVPVPGGSQEHEEGVSITHPEDVRETIELTHRAFNKEGLNEAWERVIAVVVQPGVEFGDDFILDYRPELARNLSAYIASVPHLIYEAHSTDYQTGSALRNLVRDHFAILKVGPALTYAYREAVFSLAHIETELFPAEQQSHLVEVIEAVMNQDPNHWRKYYHGSPTELAFARKYSLSDRIRYYWPTLQIQAAMTHLLDNLRQKPIPFSLLSQYTPEQCQKIREGELVNEPGCIIQDRIFKIVKNYARACNI
jgi:D-tagatose-1,6-bisphosphate aldolase subunit GatZ/KbaZ